MADGMRRLRVPEHCVRCGDRLVAHTMSMFNLDILCIECREDERAAPGYEEAAEAEGGACRAGDFSFTGVGLNPETQAFLARRRLDRRPVPRGG